MSEGDDTRAPAGAGPGAGAAAPARSPFVSASPEAGPPRRRRLRALLYSLAVAVCAFATGLWAFNALVMPRLVHGPGDVVVPDLHNLTVSQAERALRGSGLQVSRAGERFDPLVPRGLVTAQEPAAGTPVRGQRRVMVVVSLGEEFSTVPDLSGASRRTAELQLERAGLVPGGVTLVRADDAPEGLVLATDPPADALLARGTAVAMLLSAGPADEAWVMPDVVGRDLVAARRQFEALGLHVRLAESAPATGAVAAQTPEPGVRLTRASEIVLQGSGQPAR